MGARGSARGAVQAARALRFPQVGSHHGAGGRWALLRITWETFVVVTSGLPPSRGGLCVITVPLTRLSKVRLSVYLFPCTQPSVKLTPTTSYIYSFVYLFVRIFIYIFDSFLYTWSAPNDPSSES